MIRTQAWISGFGLATLCSMVALLGCSSEGNNNGGTGGDAAAKGGATATGSGGAAATYGGSPSGNGGSTTTGSGGTSASSGGSSTASGGVSAGTDGPYACKGTVATCSTIADFPTGSSQVWGTGEFSGGISVFGAGLVRDATSTSALHVTGTVKGYGHGFNLWFSNCSSLAAFTGVSFKIGGTAGTPATFDFQPQTNSDYPWEADKTVKKGGCTATDGTMPWNSCIAPGKLGIALPATPTVVPVLWSEVTGGMPTAWAAGTSPGEVIGLQWQFPWSAAATEYAVDVTLDDVTLTGGTQAACGNGSTTTGTGGSGSGSGGGASTGGGGGASNGGSANGGSSSGGVGGASAGASNSGGSSNSGGKANSGGMAGTAGIGGN